VNSVLHTILSLDARAFDYNLELLLPTNDVKDNNEDEIQGSGTFYTSRGGCLGADDGDG
jgi:hypothetical protein